MPGQLFTQYFLTDGIRHTAAWHKSVTGQDDFDAFRTALSDLLNKVAAYQTPNEAATEQDLIRPLFRLLGWNDYLPQQGSDRNEDIPDHLLFVDDAAYILYTFPIVRRNEEAAFGHYRTKAMILAYYKALAAYDMTIHAAF